MSLMCDNIYIYIKNKKNELPTINLQRYNNTITMTLLSKTPILLPSSLENMQTVKYIFFWKTRKGCLGDFSPQIVHQNTT